MRLRNKKDQKGNASFLQSVEETTINLKEDVR